MKLSAKLLVIILLGAIPTVLLSGFFIYSQIKTVMQDSLGAAQLEIAKSSMREIDRLLYERYSDIQSIAELKSVREVLSPGSVREENFEEALFKTLERFSIITGPWDLLHVINSKGEIMVSTEKRMLGKEIERDPLSLAVARALKGLIFYSDVFVDEDTGKLTAVFAAPVTNEVGGKSVLGAVLGEFSWQTILQVLDDLPLHAVLVNNQGIVIGNNAEYTTANFLLKNFDDRGFVQGVIAKKSGSTILPSGQGFITEESLLSFAPQLGYLGYRGSGWGLLIEVPASIIFAPAKIKAAQVAILLILLVLIMFLFIIMVINKGIIQPIIFLDKLVKDISKGNFSRRAEIASKDEIGELAGSFNKMATELGLLYAGLENKVRERTQEIQKEKNKLEVTLESIGDGAFSINTSGQIVFFNKIAEQISGYPLKEVIGKHYRSVLRFVLEKDNSENYQFIIEALEKGVISRISNHTVLIAKDGSKIPVEDSAAPLKDENGMVVGVVVIFRDVTKARELEKTKINFISIASHQLRTPLTALRWITEMFLSGDLGRLTKDQKKFSGDMHKSVRRLLDLINIFLVSSRVEEGRVDIKPVPVDIVGVTQGVIAGLEPLIKVKKLNVIVIKQPLPQINLELEMFRQVILNIISNAINYTPDSGTISVEFKLDNEQVICSVKDTGIGIPKKDQNRIFQKFFRADNATTIVSDGSGLGLSLVKSIVETWGGKVWFDSEEGRGTNFYFTVPLIGIKSRVGEVKINA